MSHSEWTHIAIISIAVYELCKVSGNAAVLVAQLRLLVSQIGTVNLRFVWASSQAIKLGDQSDGLLPTTILWNWILHDLSFSTSDHGWKDWLISKAEHEILVWGDDWVIIQSQALSPMQTLASLL